MFKNICQHKLLAWKANQTSRAQPPSFLEWKSIKDATKMALDLQASDGNPILQLSFYFNLSLYCNRISLYFRLHIYFIKDSVITVIIFQNH